MTEGLCAVCSTELMEGEFEMCDVCAFEVDSYEWDFADGPRYPSEMTND